MKLTTRRITGHLAMFQTVTAVSLSPITPPTCLARPPLSVTAMALIASSTSSTSVSTTRVGSVFQTGRPSLDVVDRVGRAHERGDVARGRPERARQADDEEHTRRALRALQVLDRALKISWAGPGATSPRLSISGWVAESPIRPSTDTSTSSAGKIARMP